MSTKARCAWPLAFFFILCVPAHAVVRYTVALTDPLRHIVKVTMEVPAGRDTHELQLPVWNALYQIRDFVQFMDNITATDPAGRPLSLQQLKKSRWLLSGARNGARIEYQMFRNDPGPFGAEFNPQHAFFNLAEILIYADDLRPDADELEFTNLPPGWKIGTALMHHGLVYEARNYDELVDSPVELSNFQQRDFAGSCGEYHVIVDAANAADALDRIVPPLEKIVNAATAWMSDCPFQNYTFLYHFPDAPEGGGMEHAFSTAITVPAQRLQADPEDFTAITAHEFFHLWNVKRIRPRSLEPVDYTKENYTDALWFCEGVDTTAADYIRLKAGLVDAPAYLKNLSEAITEIENRPAHLYQSAEQSSLDAWLEKYPYYDLSDRSISYYDKGELLGVVLDLKIRKATHGRESLQTLFRWMNQHYAKQGKFFADTAGIRQAAEGLTGVDLRGFFADYVAGVREIPWNEFFSYVGLRVSSVDVSLAHRGFDIAQKFDQPPTVVRVQPGSEAESAGLEPGDIVLSVNGLTAGPHAQDTIDNLGPGAELRLQVRREGVPLDIHWKLGARRMRIYELEDVPSVTPEQKSARQAWLSQDSSGKNTSGESK